MISGIFEHPLYQSRSFRIVLLLALYCIVSFFFYWAVPANSIDDAWYADTAYSLAKDGIMKHPMFTGFASHDLISLDFPPLFILFEAGIIKLFGPGLASIRGGSILLGILILVMSYRIARYFFNRDIAYIALLLIIIHPSFIQASRIARPEALQCLLGLISVCFLISAGAKRTVYYFLAGFFSGLSFLSHFNSLTLIIAAPLFVLISKRTDTRVKAVLIFALGVCIPLIPFALRIAAHFEIFRAQFFLSFENAPGLSAESHKTNISFFNSMTSLLNEQKRYLHSPVWIFPSLLWFSSLYVYFREGGEKRHPLTMILLLLALLYGLFVYRKTSYYLVFMLPYWSATTAYVLVRLYNNSARISRTIRYFTTAMLVLSVAASFTHTAQLYINSLKSDFDAVAREVQKYVPADTIAAGDFQLWFAAERKENFRAMYAVSFIYMSDHRSVGEIFESLNCRYIIGSEWFGIPGVSSGDPFAGELDDFLREHCTVVAEPEDRYFTYIMDRSGDTIPIYRIDDY
ncbi:ArnT family glycosyltransferase [candidate division KSB1 bacterium]